VVSKRHLIQWRYLGVGAFCPPLGPSIVSGQAADSSPTFKEALLLSTDGFRILQLRRGPWGPPSLSSARARWQFTLSRWQTHCGRPKASMESAT